MVSTPPSVQTFAAISVALLSHWGFFIRGELDLAAAKIARFHLVIGISITLAKCRLEKLSLNDASLQTIALLLVYSVSLFSSILFARAFLSPLNHIKGPLQFRLTKLTHVWKQSGSRNFEFLHELHMKYGDVVRTGMFTVFIDLRVRLTNWRKAQTRSPFLALMLSTKSMAKIHNADELRTMICCIQ
jgi:hypothetical protein